MAHIVANADVYIVGRIGIFFPANGQTPADGDLTGQCVTLVKWFMAEMSDVPSPFAARGDARYVGRNLVAQGHAVEVPYDQRQRGDIICLEYGTYGHIYVQLSGGRRFEENANVGGVARRVLADGTVVYASRIGSDGEAWLAGKNPHCYRLKTYTEEGAEQVVNDLDNEFWRWSKLFYQIRGRAPSRLEFQQNAVGLSWLRAMEILSDSSEADAADDYMRWGMTAKNDHWDQQIYGLQAALKQAQDDLAAAQAQLQAMGSRPTQAQLDAATKQLAEAKARADKAAADLQAVQVQQQQDQATGNAFLRWLGAQLNKILGKG